MSNGGAAVALPGGGRGNARFRALARAVVPEAASLGDAQWAEAEAIVARALSTRPESVRRQIGLFLRLLDVVAFVRHRRSFAGLPPGEAAHLLETVSRSKLLLLRRGAWGVRTLAFMGYYARPVAAGEIGYRASATGWSARGDAGTLT